MSPGVTTVCTSLQICVQLYCTHQDICASLQQQNNANLFAPVRLNANPFELDLSCCKVCFRCSVEFLLDFVFEMAPVSSNIRGSLPGTNNNGGRKKSKEWNFIKKTAENTFRCMFCNQQVSAKIDRIQKHIASCSEAKKHITCNETALVDSGVVTTNSITMDRFVMKTTAENKNELDLAVARFFFASNIPFRQVENTHFLDLVNKLRAGYKPPTRNALSEEFLDKIHLECSNDVTSNFEIALQQGKAITLCQVWIQ